MVKHLYEENLKNNKKRKFYAFKNRVDGSLEVDKNISRM